MYIALLSLIIMHCHFSLIRIIDRGRFTNPAATRSSSSVTRCAQRAQTPPRRCSVVLWWVTICLV